jgi:hypothetical protein
MYSEMRGQTGEGEEEGQGGRERERREKDWMLRA